MKVLLASSPSKGLSFCFVMNETGVTYDGTVGYDNGEYQHILNLKEENLFKMVLDADCSWIEVQAI